MSILGRLTTQNGAVPQPLRSARFLASTWYQVGIKHGSARVNMGKLGWV